MLLLQSHENDRVYANDNNINNLKISSSIFTKISSYPGMMIFVLCAFVSETLPLHYAIERSGAEASVTSLPGEYPS